MRSVTLRAYFVIAGLAAAAASSAACSSPSRGVETARPEPSAPPAAAGATTSSLKVALYPYVPRLEQFKAAISSAWQQVQPNVTLEWAPASAWDGGYSSDPDPAFDVFVFDAINLGYFQSKRMLLPLTKSQVANYGDLVSFAQTGVTDGDNVLGIPQLGCGDFLFYDASDAQLAAATNGSQLTAALGTCSYYTQTPAGKTGLMVDLSGGTTVSSTYVEGAYEASGHFPSPLPTHVDPVIAAAMQGVVALSSFSNVLYSSDSNPYQRGAWYSSGLGRAYVGFTESMSQVDPQKLATIRFKPMPWAMNSSTASPLFYSDVVGIGPATAGRGTTALAIQLANLMTSPSVIVASFGPWQAAGPQYLMPVSKTALSQLAGQFPVYAQMASVLGSLTPVLFNLGPSSKSWLDQVKPMMKSTVLANPKCYCDFPSPPIVDNNDAKTKCPTVCGQHGWNGQWTNASGASVCGCDGACTLQKRARGR